MKRSEMRLPNDTEANDGTCDQCGANDWDIDCGICICRNCGSLEGLPPYNAASECMGLVIETPNKDKTDVEMEAREG